MFTLSKLGQSVQKCIKFRPPVQCTIENFTNQRQIHEIVVKDCDFAKQFTFLSTEKPKIAIDPWLKHFCNGNNSENCTKKLKKYACKKKKEKCQSAPPKIENRQMCGNPDNCQKIDKKPDCFKGEKECQKKEEPKCCNKEEMPKTKSYVCKSKTCLEPLVEASSKDPCQKSQDDKCKKKQDPCKKKKEDPCKKKKEDPCKKKKDDPCKKKKDDPCKKKKEDPCKKKKEDPCKKKKEDPCKKKKEDPCKKKDKKCGEVTTPYPLLLATPIDTEPISPPPLDCEASTNESEAIQESHPDIFDQVLVQDMEKIQVAESYFADNYKNKEYFSYKKYGYYDLNKHMDEQRLPQPTSQKKDEGILIAEAADTEMEEEEEEEEEEDFDV